ncbi:MAG: DUF2769 domain-containing protein [Candidatus Heimdallarchaeota archaeon]|nr:DUF2769 domain-containing protein [Candidatus Heimdallarchaeota archaeon]
MIEDEDFFKNLPFEEKIKMMDMMTEQQKREGLENTKYICRDYCGKCPSREEKRETKMAFCTIGKSSLIKEKKGCLCTQCPIYRTMSLRWEYYCIEGSALEQSKTEK